MYNALYNAWNKEKQTPAQVQKLPPDFLTRLSSYTRKMKEERRMLDQKTVKAKLRKLEIRNAEKMIENLMELRYQKVLTAMTTKTSFPKEVLVMEEEKLQGEILPSIAAHKVFVKGLLQGRLLRQNKKDKKDLIVVRFVQEIPAIIGANLKTYGPFKPEDVATLPFENALTLVEQGIARRLDIT